MAKVGRPRVIPEHDELIKLGEDLVAWAENTDDGEFKHHYSQWYLKKGYLSGDWDKMLEKPEFQVYYERARAALATRYVDGTINPSLSQRFLRFYFPHLKKEENELLKTESEIRIAEKAVEAQAFKQEDLEKHKALLDQIASLQDELKQARNSTKIDR